MKIVDSFIRRLKLKLKNFNTINEKTNIRKLAIIKGSTLGENTVIGERTKVINSNISGSITIGSNALIEESNVFGEVFIGEKCKLISCFLSGNIKIGRYTSLWGPNLDIITGSQNITIGSFCSIARNVSFQSFNHNYEKVTTYFIGQNFFKEDWANEKVSKGDIIVENDVWIGTHSVILGGVTIQNGAMVAANSVVTKDVSPYSIVAGSPAKVIGYRFEQNVIDDLIKKQWWNWSNEEMHVNKNFFKNKIS